MSEKKKDKLLKDVNVVTSRSYLNKVVHNTILLWRISNYEELCCDVLYFKLFERENIKCAFRLFKTKENLYLSLSSPNVLKDTIAEFSLLDEVNNESVIEKAEQITGGVFTVKFPIEEFLLPNSNFISNGVLTVAFNYVSDYYLTNRESKLEGLEILSDLDELCYDFKRMYLDSIFPDFFIHVRDYTFKSHTVILTARSKYFDRLLKADKKKRDHTLPDDVVPGILHRVLLYMYCGELMEMNVDCMLQVYKLAVDLDVSRLCSRCIDYFRKEIDMDNYMNFCKFAAKMTLKELKNMIIHVANERFPDVVFNVLDVFKQVDEDKATVPAIEKVKENVE